MAQPGRPRHGEGGGEGLGDAAYFSVKKESLVLEGDRLLKLRLEFMPPAELRFAALANTLLKRM